MGVLEKALRIVCPIWLVWCFAFALALAERGDTAHALIIGGCFLWTAFVTWVVYRA